MAINAEQLNIILAARDKEFTKAMDRSQKRVERFAKQSNKSLSTSSKSFDMIGTAAKRLAPILAASFSVSALQGMVNATAEIGVMADVAGVSAERFQELSFAASNFGIEQGKMSDILKDVNDKFGDYVQTGAGPLADFFDNIAPKVGLTADAFADLSSEQKLGKYISALEEANVSQDGMTFYLEALASDATALQGVFANNGAELDRFSKKLRDAGGVMSDSLIDEARTAKEELNAASKIIKANLTVAFAELIPFVTAGAQGFANLVTSVVDGIEAIDRFLNPISNLEAATDNVVRAMADEINQSQQLNIALGKSTNMSVAAAKEKLKEASARHENVKAAIAEQKALALSSGEYSQLLDDIQVTQDALQSISPAPDTLMGGKAAQYEAEQQRLVELLLEQQRMLDADEELSEQFERTQKNIEELTESLANAKNGMVSFGDGVTEPIEPSDRLAHSVRAAYTATDDLNSGVQHAIPSLRAMGLTADDAASVMGTLESSMESAFMSMVDGTSSAKDAFKSMASEVIKELYRVLVVQQLVSSITGLFGGGGTLPSGVSPSTSLRPVARPAASGSSAKAGQAYMTGEHGRELFVPQVNGRILSAAQTNNAMSGGGDGVVINQTINVSTGVQQTVRTEIKQLMPQIAESTKSAVADSKRRGGSYGRSFS